MPAGQTPNLKASCQYLELWFQNPEALLPSLWFLQMSEKTQTD